MKFTVIPVLLPIFIGLLIYFFPKKHKILTIVAQSLILMSVLGIYIYYRINGMFYHDIGGYGIFGIRHKVDSLSSHFILIIAILYSVFLIYDSNRKVHYKIFKMLFFITQGLMIGLFLSNDIFNIYILIEFSTVLITILVMFHKDGRSVYDGLIYLMINLVGMNFFLLGIGFLYKLSGVLDIDEIKIHIQEVPNSELIIPYALVMTGVALKTAMLPLFSWLPKAHGTKSAPSIISATLSGIFIKTGIFLFIRIQEMFIGKIEVNEFFFILGALTAIIGSFFAFAQKDIKLILAYSTVSQVGLIMMGLNSTQISRVGAIYHIINHSFFKSLLFLGVGFIIHYYNVRDIYKIRGVLTRVPYVGVMMMIAIFSVTGFPLLNGSISKHLIGKEMVGMEQGLFYIVNLGTMMYYLRMSMIFLPSKDFLEPIKIRKRKVVSMGILSIFCIVGGLFPQVFMKSLFEHFTIIDPKFYIKLLEYVFLTIIALGICYILSKEKKWIKSLREDRVTFNSATIMIALFFFIILGYLSISIK